MPEIYEIMEETGSVERFGKLSVQYYNMDVEGLLYLLSCYYDVQFVASLYDGDLKSRVACFELNDSTLKEALQEIQRILPNLRFRVYERIVMIYDRTKTSSEQLRNPLEFLLVHHASCSDKPVEIRLSDFMGYLAYYFNKSIFYSLETLHPELTIKLPIVADQKLGNITHLLEREIPGIQMDFFEDVICFTRKEPTVLIL